jgi:hypothetical protein
MFAPLHKLFRSNNYRRTSKPLRRRARLNVEALEQRDVPTVVFQPYFGAETVTTNGSIANVAMPNPTVNVIFSGSYWTTSQGQQDQATILNSAQAIMSGPYLSGLEQYGSYGKATLGAHWTDGNTLPIDTANKATSPTGGAVQSFLQNSITFHHQAPGAYSVQTSPIYVVISDPTSSNQYTGGWNSPGTYEKLVYLPGYGEYVDRPESIHMIWFGTAMNGANINKDDFSLIFSHELAETISDPTGGSVGGVTVNPPAAEPLNLGDQISDNEPELGWAHYDYRLGGASGNLVQAYWSVKDQAFIVPDGNSQQIDLLPQWNADLLKKQRMNPGPAFLGEYALTVTGDQLRTNPNDNIQISTANYGQDIQVVLNSESFTFEPYAITAMTVDTRGGTNTVQVNSLSYGVSLDIISTGAGSNDSVYLGANGSLAGIEGSVNVANSSGHTSLYINESADGAGSVTLTQSSVAFANDPYANITYQEGYVGNDGQLHGVTSLTLGAAPGSAIDAESVGPLTHTSVDWYPGLTGLFGQNGLLTGPAANQVFILYPILHA